MHDLSEIYYSVANNDALLTISKEIFKRWFIEFDLPCNLLKFKNKELKHVKDFGDIPMNFEVDILPKLADVVDCLHSKKPENTHNQTDKILLQVYNIAKDGLISLSKAYHVNDSDYNQWTKNIEVSAGDCVITNVGRIGAIAQIPEGYKFGIGRNMTAVRITSTRITPTYLIDYLLSDYMSVQSYRQTDVGTILDSLNVKGIKLLKVLVPPKELVLAYEELMRPIRQLIEINNDVSLFEVDGSDEDIEQDDEE
jgi:type I restriction enzyme S subunit